MHIIADLSSLDQYVAHLKISSVLCSLSKCPHCGKNDPWRHGGYGRKADRENLKNTLNPIFIQRYYCNECNRTTSVLPECIPPLRWYSWAMQHHILFMIITGSSFRAIANQTIPSRNTISRWLSGFKNKFLLHKDIICNQFIELGRLVTFNDFWQTCLNLMPLSKAMYLCHVSGEIIP